MSSHSDHPAHGEQRGREFSLTLQADHVLRGGEYTASVRWFSGEWWTFWKHPDGHWVTLRKALPLDFVAAGSPEMSHRHIHTSPPTSCGHLGGIYAGPPERSADKCESGSGSCAGSRATQSTSQCPSPSPLGEATTGNSSTTTTSPAAAAADDDIPIGVHGRPTGRTLVEVPAVDEELRMLVGHLREEAAVFLYECRCKSLLLQAADALSARTKGGPANG